MKRYECLKVKIAIQREREANTPYIPTHRETEADRLTATHTEIDRDKETDKRL